MTGEESAAAFEAENAAFIEAISAIPDNLWSQARTEEGWTLGVAACHVAGWHSDMVAVLDAVTNGKPMHVTPDGLNARNAARAEADATRTKDDAIAQARTDGARVAAALRALTHEQLARTSQLGTFQMTTEQVCQRMVVGHISGHASHITAALAAAR